MKYRKLLMVVGAVMLLVVGMIIGSRFGKGGQPGAHETDSAQDHAAHSNAQTVWTCSMHPQIKLPKAGKCPICFMDLVPLQQSGDSRHADTPSRIALSPLARTLASITTVPAVRRGLASEVRLSGKVAIDETKQEVIAARFHGRIDRLYVNTTGVTVRAGDHLAEMYSPDLISAQQELLSASNALESSSTTASDLSQTYMRTLGSAKEKLRLLGFSESDISAVLARKTPADHMTIRSSQRGIVLEKMAVEGAYVEAGMPLYTVADLSTVWVKLDAYESDLIWLKPGQKVEFTVEAWPGETFAGKIHFIDPVVDPMMRTVKVRVEAPNPNGRLKPEMLVRAAVRADVSASGKIRSQNLRGKWMCPMHPNVVKSGPGTCDECGMPLETAESLGYATSGLERIDPLVIPASAPLLTGERAVVYVQVDSADLVMYEGREVVLGPRVGEYYIVKSGLTEGEKVVVNGAFQIDSELQIQAKKSMMNPQSDNVASSAHSRYEKTAGTTAQQSTLALKEPSVVSPSMLQAIEPLYAAYFSVAEGLCKDDVMAAKKSFNDLAVAVQNTGSANSSDRQWRSIIVEFQNALKHRDHIETLPDARTIFEKVSAQLIRIAKLYVTDNNKSYYVAFCPMAFDGRGAYWLQKEKEISNPYFGPSMLKCGEINEDIGNQSTK